MELTTTFASLGDDGVVVGWFDAGFIQVQPVTRAPSKQESSPVQEFVETDLPGPIEMLVDNHVEVEDFAFDQPRTQTEADTGVDADADLEQALLKYLENPGPFVASDEFKVPMTSGEPRPLNPVAHQATAFDEARVEPPEVDASIDTDATWEHALLNFLDNPGPFAADDVFAPPLTIGELPQPRPQNPEPHQAAEKAQFGPELDTRVDAYANLDQELLNFLENQELFTEYHPLPHPKPAIEELLPLPLTSEAQLASIPVPSLPRTKRAYNIKKRPVYESSIGHTGTGVGKSTTLGRARTGQTGRVMDSKRVRGKGSKRMLDLLDSRKLAR